MTNNLHRSVQISRGKKNSDGPIHELRTTISTIQNHALWPMQTNPKMKKPMPMGFFIISLLERERERERPSGTTGIKSGSVLNFEVPM